jgi:hypothetical protein
MAQSSSGQVNINLTSAQLYWLYLFLLIGDLVLAFVVKVLPSTYGVAGLAPIAIAFLGTLADDYTATVTPGGLPPWVTYVVMSAVMGVAVGIGSLTSDTFLSEVSALAWLILVIGAIGQDAAEYAGDQIPTYVETVIQAVVGVGITFLTWLSDNTTATWGVILATLIGLLASYFHVTAMAARSAKPSGSSAVD